MTAPNPFSNQNCELFAFDDLLVSVCQEVMSNGMETSTIPETIKDWLSGKLVRALPKRLTQKLLAFFLDNRDMEGVLAYKEKNYTEVPEFTILMYRTEKSKQRMERKEAIKRRAGTFIEDEFLADGSVPENVFDEAQVADQEGIGFFGEELIVDPTQKVPLKPQAKIEHMEKENERLAKQFLEMNEPFPEAVGKEADQKSENQTASDSESNEDYSPKPKRRKNTTSNKKRPAQGCFKKGFKYKGSLAEAEDLGLMKASGKQKYRVSCEVCCRPFHRPIRLYQHQAKEHAQWFALNPPPGKVSGYNKKENILCRICYPNSEHDTKVDLLKHQRDDHPIWWAKRDAVSNNSHMENQEKVDSYEEIQVDAETGNLICNVCGKIWGPTDRGNIAKHVESKHRKETKAECTVCGMKFAYKDSLRRHMFTHTGEYPEECELCGKKFPTRWRLKQHWEINHKQVPCPVVLHYSKNGQAVQGSLPKLDRSQI